jgi:hypothetical protein
MASMGRIASNTGWPPRGSLYIPTTEPPAISTAARASAAEPAAFSSRVSSGVSPLVPGFAFRGRRRAGARLTMATHSNWDPTSSPDQFAACHHNRNVTGIRALMQSERCAAPRESVGAGAGGFLFIDYPSIQQVNAAFGMPGEAGIVGDHADGRAFLVQFTQQFHNSVRVL